MMKENVEKVKRYGSYAEAIEAIEPYIESIKRKIAMSKNGIINIKTKKMAKKLGMDKKKGLARGGRRRGLINPKSIHAGVKYVLFFKGIMVGTGTDKNGDHILVMRKKMHGDRLPPHMERYGRKKLKRR